MAFVPLNVGRLPSAAALTAPHNARTPLPVLFFGKKDAGNGVKLVANGKSVTVPAGSSLMAATKKLGLKVPTNCKKGDCATCMVNVGGKNIKACQGKVPPAPNLASVREKGLQVKVTGGPR